MLVQHRPTLSFGWNVLGCLNTVLFEVGITICSMLNCYCQGLHTLPLLINKIDVCTVHWFHVRDQHPRFGPNLERSYMLQCMS